MKTTSVVLLLLAAHASAQHLATGCVKTPTTQVLADGETLMFESPNYPLGATGKNKCRWEVEVGPNSDLEIWCQHFDIQGTNKKNKCEKSYFKFEKGERFCGTNGPVSVL